MAPAIRVPAGGAMLFLSICGMAIGLAIDCGVTPPALLAALCAGASGSPAATLSFHVAVMPASYAVMGGAAVVAAALNGNAGRSVARQTPARLAAGAASVVLMVAGMFAGGWLAPDAAALLGAEPGFGPLVLGMVTGMVVATLVAAAIAYVLDAATARAK
jgi:hypothetical protein